MYEIDIEFKNWYCASRMPCVWMSTESRFGMSQFQETRALTYLLFSINHLKEIFLKL